MGLQHYSALFTLTPPQVAAVVPGDGRGDWDADARRVRAPGARPRESLACAGAILISYHTAGSRIAGHGPIPRPCRNLAHPRRVRAPGARARKSLARAGRF